ncbi:MAG TPA: hypothetical protein VHO03_21010 [Ignavibacteriales bacterium]|nr:hypothetical protein [Ignavibacteriales bacterium]
MKSVRYLSLISAIFIIAFCSCNKGTEPVEKNSSIFNQIRVVEINAVIPADTTITRPSPLYSVLYSSLSLNGVELYSLKYTYPVKVNCEFVLSPDDSFTIEIKGCNKDKRWLVDPGDIKLNSSATWINSEVQLISSGKSFNPDSTISNRFTFKALKNSKGYVCFIETDQSGSASSNESHGLLIGYDVNPLGKVSTQITSTEWKYNDEGGYFSTVRCRVKGTTNAYRLRGMTYGDGLAMAMEIPIINNNFDVEIPVAFSHVKDITLTTSTNLIVYGTVGSPKIIKLINPRSQN